MNYNEIVNRAYSGEVLIGVEPAVARRFFTDATRNVIEDEIGESFFIERSLLTVINFILQPVSLGAGFIVCVLAFKWYSLPIIPVVFVAWFFYAGIASVGKQKIIGISLITGFCFLLAYYFSDSGVWLTIWLVLLPLPFFFARLTYKLATFFLRNLVLRNEKAFNLLSENAIFLKENSAG